jgi:AraC-like DNA-binding protein
VRGIDLEDFLDSLGVTIDEYTDPGARIPVSLMQRAWGLAHKWTRDDCFGLTLADVVQPAALHGLGLSMVASDTLLHSIKRIISYQRFLSTVLKISLDREKDQYRINFSMAANRKLHPASVDGALAIFMKMCRITAGSPVKPVQVRLQRERPSSCFQQYRRLFDCPVAFSGAENQILFDALTLERQLTTANPQLARINDQVVIEYLKHFDSQTLAERLRSMIIEDLPGGMISEAMLAKGLNMSQRNLQRLLKQEETSYQRILSETRLQLAQEYLANSTRQIIEIGYLLGFSEPGNFSRAFKRWTGQSPQQYRSQTLHILTE